MRRRSAPTVIEADSRTDGSPPPHPAGDEERRGAVTPPYGSTTGGAQQPRAIPQSRLRRASSCCGTQNSLFAKRSQNFDHCHSFLLASSATGGARKRPPLHKGALGTGDADCRVASLLAMTVLNLCHSEKAQRTEVGIRPFLRWTGDGPPRSSAPTEGLPKPQQQAGVGIGPYGKPNPPPKPAGAQRSVRACGREGWAGIDARTISKWGPPPRLPGQRLAKRKARKEPLVKFSLCPMTSEFSTAQKVRKSDGSPARAHADVTSTE